MKFKVGDKVRVKSLDWYNANKDVRGDIYFDGNYYFVEKMSKYCGELITIKYVSCTYDGYCIIEDGGLYTWYYTMFEQEKIEDNTNTTNLKFKKAKHIKSGNIYYYLADNTAFNATNNVEDEKRYVFYYNDKNEMFIREESVSSDE